MQSTDGTVLCESSQTLFLYKVNFQAHPNYIMDYHTLTSLHDSGTGTGSFIQKALCQQHNQVLLLALNDGRGIIARFIQSQPR